MEPVCFCYLSYFMGAAKISGYYLYMAINLRCAIKYITQSFKPHF